MALPPDGPHTDIAARFVQKYGLPGIYSPPAARLDELAGTFSTAGAQIDESIRFNNRLFNEAAGRIGPFRKLPNTVAVAAVGYDVSRDSYWVLDTRDRDWRYIRRDDIWVISAPVHAPKRQLQWRALWVDEAELISEPATREPGYVWDADKKQWIED